MAVEPLAESIRSNESTVGPLIADQEHKLSLYADYIELYVVNPVNSFHISLILMPNLVNSLDTRLILSNRMPV